MGNLTVLVEAVDDQIDGSVFRQASEMPTLRIDEEIPMPGSEYG